MTVINLCEGQEMQQVEHCTLQVRGSGRGAKQQQGDCTRGKCQSLSKEAEAVGLDMVSLKEMSSREVGIVNPCTGQQCSISGEGEGWGLMEMLRILTKGQAQGGKICCLPVKSLPGNPLPAGLARCRNLVYSAIPEV